MSQAAFDIALGLLLDLEGGYVDNPKDPGGPTKLGVSWRAVRLRDVDKDGLLDFDLDKDGDVDAEDIKLVSRAHAELLFREDYWDPCRCDELPPGLAVAVADAAYNQGPRTAGALLQRALGITQDGIVGDKTIRAVWALTAQSVPQLRRLTRHFLRLRLLRYAANSEAKTFLAGWTDRVLQVLELAVQLGGGLS